MNSEFEKQNHWNEPFLKGALQKRAEEPKAEVIWAEKSVNSKSIEMIHSEKQGGKRKKNE